MFAPRQMAFTKALRFKLSSLILLTSVAAVVCLEGRWHYEQRQLEQAAIQIGARIDYQRRSTVSYLWSFLVFSPRPSYISGLRINAYLVNSRLFESKVVSAADLTQLLFRCQPLAACVHFSYTAPPSTMKLS